LDAFYKGGKNAGEAIINTGKGKELRDSIFKTITSLDATRRENISNITNSIGQSGSRARIWGGFMALLACVLLGFAFWYVMNLFTYQQKSIASLNESKQQIKEASSIKEQFMANMSHEIRTPMNAIIGFTNILKRTDLDPQQRQYVQNIHTAGENLLALVNDILDLSKIEAGMMLLEEKNFSLRSLIASVTNMFREKITEKGLTYKEDIDEQIPDILCGDAVRLTQVLVNLLGNAIKFTDTGEIRLSAQLLRVSEKGVELQMKVADTGIGIAKEKQGRIFERFQQAETETTRKFGGTGLGLSIVRQIVEIQGGTLSLISESGKGSEFTFTIPYSLPDEEKMLSEALAMENDPVSIKDVKVLIAEDNPMNQQLIKHLMKNWEIQFTIVSNGAEAVDALQKDEFSLVLMDIQMPEMDGYQAIETIRKHLHSDIPVIAMTAHAMMGEKEKCLQLGMNDYISKPLKETVLYNIIAQYSYYGAKPKT
jgi:signal transduction histidine kinase/CheY-like chemotaxis protein